MVLRRRLIGGKAGFLAAELLMELVRRVAWALDCLAAKGTNQEVRTLVTLSPVRDGIR